MGDSGFRKLEKEPEEYRLTRLGSLSLWSASVTSSRRQAGKTWPRICILGHYLGTESSKDLPLSGAGNLKIGFKSCKLRLLSCQIQSIEIRQKPRSLKQKFRDLGKRLNVG